MPADIEAYQIDDHLLLKVLRNSSSPYAQAIIKNEIPSKIFESFNEEQLNRLNLLQGYLEDIGASFIRGSSSRIDH